MEFIELRRLRAFVAVAEEEHVTRAAERLGMQQPPLTRLLAGLERDLGVSLLHRLPRGVRPTEAGLALLEEARAVLARAEGVAEAVRRAARGEKGRLAIGFTGSAALHPLVPAVLRRFRAAWPGVSIVLEEASSSELENALQQQQLDAAFIRSAGGWREGLTAEPVLEEAMLAALPADHALAAETSPLPLIALAREAFILYRRQAGAGLYDTILTACRDAGFNPSIAQEAPRLPATFSLVAAGMGVSIVPASMQRLGGEGVVYRPLTDCPRLTAILRLATRKEPPSPTLRHFRDLVRDMRSSFS
ncbi:LysR substrate binding domain protein [Acetobacteraceae bacterium AT-5844]|nr:LysR substrate binding domain protein [Acetobacteraceae bacterium AT-5844]